MGETIFVRDVDPDTKEKLEAAAKAAGVSLSAWLRERFDELVSKPKRKIGALEHLGPVGEPIDGWGPMSDDDLALWEGEDEEPLS